MADSASRSGWSLARRAVTRVRSGALAALGRSAFGTITSVATEEPLVALTFDDGPDPRWTPRVLDVLAAHGAKATFFVIGARVDAHPDLVARLHAEGHALGNHSYNHSSFPGMSAAQRRMELRACARALAAYPQRRRLFRPPHLDQNLASRFDAWRVGYHVVACNRHAEDWEEHTSVEMARTLDKELRPGDIVLLHDSLFDRPERDRTEMLEALDAVLGHHRDRFRFVTVPELLAAGRARRELWIKRPHGRRAVASERPAA